MDQPIELTLLYVSLLKIRTIKQWKSSTFKMFFFVITVGYTVTDMTVPLDSQLKLYVTTWQFFPLSGLMRNIKIHQEICQFFCLQYNRWHWN
jgi:hypothetical protein